MAQSQKGKNWIFPIAASLLLHLCLVAALSVQQTEKTSQEPRLTLVMRSVPAQAKSSVPPAQASETRPPATHTPKPPPRETARKPEQAAKTEPAAKSAANKPAGVADRAPSDQNGEASKGDTPSENVSGSGGGDGAHANQSGQAGSPIVSVNTLSIAKKVIPDYPSFSRKRGEEGQVIIIVTIKNGAVIKAEIRESSEYERLNNSALRAAKQWRFYQEEEIRAILPFIFRLDS